MPSSAIPEKQLSQRQRGNPSPNSDTNALYERAERPRHVQRPQPLFEPVVPGIAHKAAHGAARGVDEHGGARDRWFVSRESYLSPVRSVDDRYVISTPCFS